MAQLSFEKINIHTSHTHAPKQNKNKTPATRLSNDLNQTKLWQLFAYLNNITDNTWHTALHASCDESQLGDVMRTYKPSRSRAAGARLHLSTCRMCTIGRHNKHMLECVFDYTPFCLENLRLHRSVCNCFRKSRKHKTAKVAFVFGMSQHECAKDARCVVAFVSLICAHVHSIVWAL